MVFHWSLSDKFPQVSRTLLSILAVLNNAVVWMVSTRHPTSKSSSPFYNPLVTVPKAPITIGINVTFMFHSFFSIPEQGRGTYPYFYFLSVLFCGQPRQQSPQFCKFSSFLLLLLFITIRSGLLAEIRGLEKMRFILSVRSDFHMTDSLSIAVHAFASHVLMSVSVDETLLPR